MIIAVPTAIKIFSWLSYSFSKNYMTNNLYFVINNRALKSNLDITNLLIRFPRSSLKYLPSNDKCKELVLYGTNLVSTIKYPYYTKIIRYMVNIPKYILDPLVGILLSDGSITVSSTSKIK